MPFLSLWGLVLRLSEHELCKGASLINVSVRMLPNFSGLHSYHKVKKPQTFQRIHRKISSHGESFAKWSRKSARIIVLLTSGDFNSQSDRSGVVLRVILRCSSIGQGVSRADEDERVRAKRFDAVDWDQIMDLQIKVTASWEQENELWVCQLFNNRRKIGRRKNSIHCILFGIELLATQTNSK